MTYTQSPIECGMYLNLPYGIESKAGNSRAHVLKILQNIYSQKQVGKFWAGFLSENLFNIGFKKSKINECVFSMATLCS